MRDDGKVSPALPLDAFDAAGQYDQPEPNPKRVLDEASLHRVVGSRQVMREQLEHVMELSQLPHVTVQVLPFEVGAHAGINGQYSILEFADAADSSVVYIEGVTSDLYLEKPHDVQKYTVMYEHLRAQSLNVEQSRQLVERLAKDYAR